MKRIYLDHAATTPFFSDRYANPSSFHSAGLDVKRAVAAARKTVADAIHAHEDEIIFCSGGTESDNLALQGIIRAHADHGDHVVTSAVEHPAVLETLTRLAKKQVIDLTVVPVDSFGSVEPKEVMKAVRDETVLVSVMYANNEIGTIEPITEIGREILAWRKKHDTKYPLFHTDACQAAAALDMDVEKLHVDLLTFNGSKIYGPKGIGALYVRRTVKLEPMIFGGGQERSLRSGTENVPGIIGLAKALEIAQARRERENKRLRKLRDHLVDGLLTIPKSRLNGHPDERLANSANISFLDMEGEAAVLYLDAKGIMASTGSACASKTLDPSHVILATGVSYEAAHGSLRFSLGRATTRADIDEVIRVMPGIVNKLRHMSPVKLDMKYFGA
jgi:cysteine desulfurase